MAGIQVGHRGEKMKRFILIATILIAVGAAVVLNKRFAARHDDGTLSLSGNVEVTEIDLGFKTSGRVMEVFVQEGDRVTKGDRLAVLDSSELEALVSQNRAGLNEALARLEKVRAGARPQEVEQAKAGVASAEAELGKAGKDYERVKGLFEKGIISAQEVDSAKKVYDVAISQHHKSLEVLSLVKEGTRKEEIVAAMEKGQQAVASLKVSQERLKDAVLYAPTSGVVLKRNVEPGEAVGAGSPVYTIGDMEKPWVKVYVKENRLGLVKLGQKAGVTVDSYPGKIYNGKVTFISSEAEFTPKNVQTQEERVKLVFGMKVAVKNINDELKPGMPADVRIKLQ